MRCRNPRNKELGRIFGYPECCIEFFESGDCIHPPFDFITGPDRSTEELKRIALALIDFEPDMLTMVGMFPRWRACPKCAENPPPDCKVDRDNGDYRRYAEQLTEAWNKR